MVNLFFHTLKLFTWDLVLSLATWPVWWYSRGLIEFSRFIRKHINQAWHNQALSILIKNWFKPMYAQWDWQGRIISFFFRTLMIGWRFVFFFIWLVVLLVLFVVWLIVPLLAVIMFVRIFFFTAYE